MSKILISKSFLIEKAIGDDLVREKIIRKAKHTTLLTFLIIFHWKSYYRIVVNYI